MFAYLQHTVNVQKFLTVYSTAFWPIFMVMQMLLVLPTKMANSVDPDQTSP